MTYTGDTDLTTLQEPAPLPMAVLDGDELACGHGCDSDVVLEESGYVRTWRLSIENGVVTAHYGGSADWSENGDGEYVLRCYKCLKASQLPFSDWEWE
jgi:hypothetical protein